MTTGWRRVFDQSFQRVPISRLHEMYDSGFRVMAGYAGGGSSSKWLTAKEISTWLGLGDDTGIGALFEIAGTEPIDNPASAAAHAKAARTAWRNLGYPDECSISPAVDRDVTVAQARAQLTQYFSNWTVTDTALPIPYVEMDAGAILFEEKISAGTFTPAAYGWDPSNTLVTSDNAPSHVVWTQEHNGQSLSGGDVDTGNIRETANIYWKDGRNMTAAADDVWKDDIIANPTQRADHATNPTTQALFALGDAWQRIYDLRDAVAKLNSAVATLSTNVAKIPTTTIPAAPIDINALAAAIVKATPPVHGTFTETE